MGMAGLSLRSGILVRLVEFGLNPALRAPLRVTRVARTAGIGEVGGNQTLPPLPRGCRAGACSPEGGQAFLISMAAWWRDGTR